MSLFSKCCCSNPAIVKSKFVNCAKYRHGFEGFDPPVISAVSLHGHYEWPGANPLSTAWDGTPNFTAGQGVVYVKEYYGYYPGWSTTPPPDYEIYVCIADVTNATTLWDEHFMRIPYQGEYQDITGYHAWNDTQVGTLNYNPSTHLTTSAYSQGDIVQTSTGNFIAVQDVPIGTYITSDSVPNHSYFAPFLLSRNVMADLNRYFMRVRETTDIIGWDAAIAGDPAWTSGTGGDGTYVRERKYISHFDDTLVTLTDELAPTIDATRIYLDPDPTPQTFTINFADFQFPNLPTSTTFSTAYRLLAFDYSATKLSWTWEVTCAIPGAPSLRFSVVQTVELFSEYTLGDVIAEAQAAIGSVSFDSLNWGQSADVTYDTSGAIVVTLGASPMSYAPNGTLGQATGEWATGPGGMYNCRKAQIQYTGHTFVATFKTLETGGAATQTNCVNNQIGTNLTVELTVPDYDLTYKWIQQVFAQGTCAGL